MEVVRKSTSDEWKNYGKILRQIDEAKQWIVGDWLVDGKRHYGDGLYKEASAILECSEGDLRNMKSLAERFQLSVRTDKLSWRHHYEVASIKALVESKKGKLGYGDTDSSIHAARGDDSASCGRERYQFQVHAD
jgi:hypothetical protein